MSDRRCSANGIASRKRFADAALRFGRREFLSYQDPVRRLRPQLRCLGRMQQLCPDRDQVHGSQNRKEDESDA